MGARWRDGRFLKGAAGSRRESGQRAYGMRERIPAKRMRRQAAGHA